MYRFEKENQETRMDIYLRYFIVLIIVVLLTRWLTRKAEWGFSWSQLLIAMAAKVIMGSLYGFVFLRFYGGDDTWFINGDSMNELEKLLTRPAHFFEDVDIFRLVSENGWAGGLAVFQMKMEQALIIKPLAIVNLISGGNYYINVVAFSGISFWGHFWLYQACLAAWPQLKQWLFLLIFLYPPTLFWLSGIRSDAWLFFFFGLLIYIYGKWLARGQAGYLVLTILALAGISFIRAPLVAVIIPSLVAWWLVVKKQIPQVKAFLGVHMIAMVMFFLSGLLPSPLNLPEMVAEKQASFFTLEGKTRVSLQKLEPSPASFIKLLPQAADNAFLQPRPWNASGALQLLMVVQNLVLLGLFLTLIARRYPGRALLAPYPMSALLAYTALLTCLFIGYTIPFPGALVRYRAIPELCLLIWLSLAAAGDKISHYNLINVYKNRGF